MLVSSRFRAKEVCHMMRRTSAFSEALDFVLRLSTVKGFYHRQIIVSGNVFGSAAESFVENSY